MKITYGEIEQCANCKRLFPPDTELVLVIARLGEPFNHKFYANICRECAQTVYAALADKLAESAPEDD